MKQILIPFLVMICFISASHRAVAQTQPALHRDTAYGYEVTVPSWLKLFDTPDEVFGGLLPEADTVQNTILFKLFHKDRFQSLSDFENWVVKDYSVGQEARWDPETVILLKNQILDFPVPGQAWKVQVLNGGFIYNCCYLLLETSKGFIWVEYSATNKSYAVNYPRFLEMVKSLKTM